MSDCFSAVKFAGYSRLQLYIMHTCVEWFSHSVVFYCGRSSLGTSVRIPTTQAGTIYSILTLPVGRLVKNTGIILLNFVYMWTIAPQNMKITHVAYPKELSTENTQCIHKLPVTIWLKVLPILPARF